VSGRSLAGRPGVAKPVFARCCTLVDLGSNDLPSGELHFGFLSPSNHSGPRFPRYDSNVDSRFQRPTSYRLDDKGMVLRLGLEPRLTGARTRRVTSYTT
jgi:hypothetical protein